MDAQFKLDNALELNPNKQINYRLTVANVIARLSGGIPDVGQVVVLPEAAVMSEFRDMILHSDRIFEVDCDLKFQKEFVRMMREGRSTGHIFFVGKGYWDITVYIAIQEAKRQSMVASMYANDHEELFRSISEKAAIKASQYAQWANVYAGAIGLNEDAN